MIFCSISWCFFGCLRSWQKHVIFEIAFVCAFMTIRISDAPSWLSGCATDNSWPAVSGGRRFWQSSNRVCCSSSSGHSLSVQQALLGLLLGRQQLFCKWRGANIERTHPRSLRKVAPPVVKRYIYTLLSSLGMNQSFVCRQLQEAFCLQEVHTGSKWSLGMCTLNKKRTSTLSLYHGATVMMEVVALHIPLNQSLACCALGR